MHKSLQRDESGDGTEKWLKSTKGRILSFHEMNNPIGPLKYHKLF